MSHLQVRNVPDDVLARLKERAAAAGQSLSEYTLAELTLLARRPTLTELTGRIRLRERSDTPTRAADLLHEARRHDAT